MDRSAVRAMAAAGVLAMAACRGGTTAPPGRPATTSPPIAPTTASATPGLRVVSDVLYQEDPDGTQHELTVFAPAAEGGPWPVVVVIHGAGGCCVPDEWVSALASQGAVVFEPSWPDNSPWPSAEAFRADATTITEQLACAVLFARDEAERYGGDPRNLALFGHSAGANYGSLIAFADPKVPDGCAAPSGSVLPDNLVLFEGDWLLMGSPVWDDLLRQDSKGVMDANTPWSYLREADRMPVHILDSNDPSLFRNAAGARRWLALRDPTGSFYRDLEELGAFDDALVSEHEASLLLSGRFQSLGHQAAFHVLANSSHGHLSDAGLEILVDAILLRT